MIPLIELLKNPKSLVDYSLKDWQLLLEQAYAEGLLARLYYLITTHKLETNLPDKIRWHFESAAIVSERQVKNALREIDEINQQLSNIKSPLIFLKGAAYCAMQMNCSFGRLFSDLDILINKEHLTKAESTLFAAGWLKTEVDNYDDLYYRQWMHEIPPLRHFERQTVIDLHHNLLPLTNKNVFSIERLQLQKAFHPWFGEVLTLSDADLFIHSTVHLFTESEYQNRLRDVSDLDLMINEFSRKDPGFVGHLVSRANELGLSAYVWLSLRYCSSVLDTKISQEQIEQLAYKPSSLNKAFLDFCFINIFKPNHSSCRNWQMVLAEFFLYWRGHLIRMPLRLLIPHLCKKMLKQVKNIFQKENKQQPML